MIWPFKRKPETVSQARLDQLYRDYKALPEGGIMRFRTPAEGDALMKLVREELTDPWANDRRVFTNRDALHALIVTTLQRHGHLNTYELADEIVAAVVEGARS